MFQKYLKLILFSSVLLYASPKAFNSLGDELEAFQEDCKTFQKTSVIPVKIKNECISFNSQTIKVFKVGYKLDPYVDSNNISESKLSKYLSLLNNLDKSKENILHLIYSEAKKARKQNNTKYYIQMIANDKVKLYASDYTFMKNHKEIFDKNERYISHLKYLESLRPIETKEKIKVATIKKKTENKVKNKRKKTLNHNSPISRVDMVDGSGYMKNDFLVVGFYYRNRSTDKLIFWKNGTISTECKVYGNAGNWIKSIQGSLLGQLSNNTITNAHQNIYIKLRKTHYESAILDCSLNIYGKTIRTRDIVPI